MTTIWCSEEYQRRGVKSMVILPIHTKILTKNHFLLNKFKFWWRITFYWTNLNISKCFFLQKLLRKSRGIQDHLCPVFFQLVCVMVLGWSRSVNVCEFMWWTCLMAALGWSICLFTDLHNETSPPKFRLSTTVFICIVVHLRSIILKKK